jgi:hypothetical protein
LENFSQIGKPLINLTKNKFKEKKFQKLDAAEYAFIILKATFSSALILKHFNLRLHMVIDTDASDFAFGEILSQVENSSLKPGSFHLRIIDKVKVYSDIYNKEWLAIMSTNQEMGSISGECCLYYNGIL